METRLQAVIDKLTLTPKHLFLIDGIGAVWTAFVLSAILAPFEDRFGMPRNILYVLSLIACIYATYSFCCYRLVRSNWRVYISAIAIANVMYTCATLALVIYYHESLTVLGMIYFLFEIIVIDLLACIELKVASRI